MESGTAKKVDFDVTPLEEGQYELSLVVTYENELGENFEEVVPVSFYCNAETTYEEQEYTYNTGEDEYGTEDDTPDAMTILSLMPWWIYAGAGAAVASGVVGVGVSARSKHRKALEDDEMD